MHFFGSDSMTIFSLGKGTEKGEKVFWKENKISYKNRHYTCVYNSLYQTNSTRKSFLFISFYVFFWLYRNPNDDKHYDGDSNPCESQPSGGNSGSGGGRSSSNEKSSKQKVIDWPCYDRLYKKYLTIGKYLIFLSFFLCLFFFSCLLQSSQECIYFLARGTKKNQQDQII